MLLCMVLWVSYEHFGVSRLRESITLTLTQTNKQQQQQQKKTWLHSRASTMRTNELWLKWKKCYDLFSLSMLTAPSFPSVSKLREKWRKCFCHRCRRRPSPSVVKLIVFVFPFLVRAPLSPRQKAVPRSKRFNRNRALDAKSYVHLIFITICQISVGRTFIG